MDDNFKSKAFQLLGHIIRKKRIEQNITQEELGEKVGYGIATRRQAVSQIERGSVSIPNKKLNVFIDTLKLDTTFITEINYLLSRGEYEEAAHFLEEREALELKIATTVSPHIPTSQEAIRAVIEGEQDPEMIEAAAPDGADGIENQTVKMVVVVDEAEVKLSKLKRLFDMQLITEAEFGQKKKDILDKYF